MKNMGDPGIRGQCLIAANNTGVGNELKFFHHDRDRAFSVINRMSRDAVYAECRKTCPAPKPAATWSR
jgi:hypothetical protein